MKKKNKGFTLIELLAVIVILAVIALIATPIILNVIDRAKKGAIKETVNGYIESIQNTVAINSLETADQYNNISCSLSNDQMLCDNESTIEVKVKGDKLDRFNILFSEKGIIESGKFRKGNYCGNYRRNKGVDFVKCDSIDASEVSFTPEDTNWKVTNVEEALDDIRSLRK